MVAFFGMIVNFFGWFTAFFARFAIFSSSASIVQNWRYALRVTLLTAFKISFFFFIALLFAFIYFSLQALVTVYNLISDVINLMQNTGVYASRPEHNEYLNLFFHFVNVTGIADGIAAVFPVVASALTFVLTRNAYRVTLFFYQRITTLYIEGVKLLTMA